MEIKRIFSIFVAISGFMNLLYGLYNFQSLENSLIMSSLGVGCILTSIIIARLFGAEKNLNFSSSKIISRFCLLIAIALIAIQTAFATGVLTKTLRISSQGTVNKGIIKTIGINAYLDSECTQPVSSIDWGSLSPGSTKNFVIYLKNEGNVDITFSISTENWSPSSASNYISLSWSSYGVVISPGQVVAVTLTLQVSDSISGVTSFSFDIVITATETA